MITKLKWKNHSILDDLELDFTDSAGKVYNTIILAGENGTGKTTILQTLSEFLNLGSFAPFDFIKYQTDNKSFHIYSKNERDANSGFHYRKNLNDNSEILIQSHRNFNEDSIRKDEFDIRHYGFAYSKARSGFKTKKVTSTTTQQLDNKMQDNDENDDFTSIKQLLVDIDAQDNSNWMQISQKRKGRTLKIIKQVLRCLGLRKRLTIFLTS